MLCQYCKGQAKFACQCKYKLCGDHLETHSKTCTQFNIKMIESFKKLKLLSTKLAKRINKIDDTIYDIMRKTQELINKLKKLCKKNVNKLKTTKCDFIHDK